MTDDRAAAYQAAIEALTHDVPDAIYWDEGRTVTLNLPDGQEVTVTVDEYAVPSPATLAGEDSDLADAVNLAMVALMSAARTSGGQAPDWVHQTLLVCAGYAAAMSAHARLADSTADQDNPDGLYWAGAIVDTATHTPDGLGSGVHALLTEGPVVRVAHHPGHLVDLDQDGAVVAVHGFLPGGRMDLDLLATTYDIPDWLVADIQEHQDNQDGTTDGKDGE